MATKQKARALGRGLSALIEEKPEINTQSGEIDVSLIDLFAEQPRKHFDEARLAELAESIEVHGIIQPLVLKPVGERYMIIAGERRFRAARRLGLKTVPAVVKDADDRSLLEMSLIENIQREDLNPIEEANAMRLLLEEHKLTQEELSARIGKSRSLIANTLRLLALPENTADMLVTGRLSTGHARALLALKDPEMIDEQAEVVAQRQLSVRETEALVKELLEPRQPRERKPKDPYIHEAEERLTASLGTKVRIKGDDKRGNITIQYYSAEQLQAIYDILHEGAHE